MIYVLCGTNLINCMYLTSEKPKAKFSSGLNSTSLTSCCAVYMTSSGRRMEVVSILMFEWPKKIIAVSDRGKVRVFGFGI